MEIIDLTSTSEYYVLSFDIGQKNLAYALLGRSSNHVYHLIDWNVVDISNSSLPTNSETISNRIVTLARKILRCNHILLTDKIDVLVEKQLLYNAHATNHYRMLVNAIIEASVHAAFISLDFPTLTIDPKMVSLYHGIQGHRGAKKRDSIRIVDEYLTGDQKGLVFSAASRLNYVSAIKKDDMADAILQALMFLGK